MNERIKKLKDLARDYYLSQEDLDCSSHRELHDMIEQKFAELIIKETLTVARAGMEYGPSMDEVVYGYFGIKE